MVKFPFLISFIFGLVGATAHPMNAQDLCTKAFPLGHWHESNDSVFFSAVHEIVKKSKTKFTIFLCEGGDEAYNVALSRIPFAEEFPSIIFVAIDTEFAHLYPEATIAIVAHEIAHYVFQDGALCKPTYYFLNEEYLACEASVDSVSAEWIGIDTAIATLEQNEEFLESRIAEKLKSSMHDAISYRIESLQKLKH